MHVGIRSLKIWIVFALLALPVLFACSGPSPFEILSMQESDLKTRGGYESYLTLEYFDFARNLQSVKDKKRANHFAKKALDVANGKYVVPENPIDWKADPAQMEEMVMMQKRLEVVLEYPHMKFYLPIQLAHLTYLYDCWISRESSAVFRADELAQCRIRFNKLLDEVERYIDDSKKDKQPGVKIKEPEFERFEIKFDLGSSKFNERANQDTVNLLNYLKNLHGDYRILLVGNADRTGLEIRNQNLALRRAEVMKDYLIKNGVAPDLIELRSVGENFPDIITREGVQQQANRVVGIYILKGVDFASPLPLPVIENEVYRQEIKKEIKERGLK